MSAALGHRLIRAAAGAGKTYELTGRYMDLLRAGAQPGEILATTFTRKAAGEILQRLLSRLAEDAAADETSRQLLATVCRNLHAVAISTIDSFFGRMASCFHFELDLPPGARMMADTDAPAVQLRAQAIDAMLADDDLPILLDLMQRLYHDSARRGVTDFIDQQVVSLYDTYREAPSADLWSQLTAPPTLGDDELNTAIKALRAVMANAEENFGKRLAGDLQKADAQIARGDWSALVGKGMAGKIAAGDPTFYKKPIADEIVAALTPLVIHAKASLIAQVAKRTEALHELLARFDKHYSQLRQRHHLLLYADLPYRLAERMNLDEALLMQVYYRLDRRVTHLLLDEFQDTSMQQWQILQPFALEVTSSADRSFFCVGDTKQAIYGWRGGCAQIFDQLEDDLFLPPDAIDSRSVSYRSSQIVLDAINDVFSNLAGHAALAEHVDTASEWAQRFETHTASDPAKRGFVELVTSLPDDHLFFVADRIEQIAQQAPSNTIGVLVSTNDRAAELINLLHRRGEVLASGEGGSPIDDDPAVLAVLAALTVADHPGDTASAYHVANSPLGAIVGLRSAQPGHVRDVALSLRATLLDQGYAQTISHWARALAPHCDARSVTRLTQLVELADGYDPNQTLRPSDFVAFARATAVEEPAPAMVRVMTVHKAKGLEFDIVVLPQLERNLGHVTSGSVTVMREQPTSPVQAVFAATTKEVRALCPPLAQAHQYEQQRRLNDDLCAMYVAMTRARHALHMIVPPLKQTKGGAPGSLGLCGAAILRDALLDADENFDGDQTLYQHGDEGWYLDSAPIEKRPPPPPVDVLNIELARSDGPTRTWRRIAPSAQKRTVADLLEIERDEGRAFGTAIHKWFERVEYLPADVQIDDDAPPDWLAAFHKMLGRPAVIEALSHPGGEPTLWRERDFAVRLGDELVRGVFDRVVITPQRVDLIDFKTDARVDEYRPQMQTYKAALAAMLHVPEDRIRTRLLQVTIGQCVEV